MSGGGHACQTRKIDAVHEHGAAKGMYQAGSSASSQPIDVAVVRHEVVAGRSWTIVLRQQFETGKLAIGDPIGLALGEKIVQFSSQRPSPLVGDLVRLSGGNDLERSDA